MMAIYVVTVSARLTGQEDQFDLYDVAVLAHSERSAKASASRSIAHRVGYVEAHAFAARELDRYKTGVIMVNRKEAAHGPARSGQPT